MRRFRSKGKAAVILIGGVFSISIISLLQSQNDIDKAWEAYKVKHRKSYPREGGSGLRYKRGEDERRKSIWEKNKKEIEEYNNRNDGFTLVMNRFADMTDKEFGQMLGLSMKQDVSNNHKNRCDPLSGKSQPESVNWTANGYVTPVENQGDHCGSCWAFSATGSIEGQYFHKTRKLIPLSEQNLVDCSRQNGNDKCKGSSIDKAFEYIKQSGGIARDEDYPYTGKHDAKCNFSCHNALVTCTDFCEVKPGTEEQLKKAVATIGPIAVSIHADNKTFKFYEKEVHDNPNCSKTPNHAVLVVGYGTTKKKGKDIDYWLVKNSWGTDWGMEGYIMMARNRDNQCGIATYALYPLVENATGCTNSESKTAESTIAASTTPESTNAESTTAKSTTAESTTAESTTAETPTAESTTAETSTAESTTNTSTTAELTNPEPNDKTPTDKAPTDKTPTAKTTIGYTVCFLATVFAISLIAIGA